MRPKSSSPEFIKFFLVTGLLMMNALLFSVSPQLVFR